MSDYIGNLKIKLIEAVDFCQEKINKITDIKEALKELESFPMTIDILNSSRIGKIVNDIRHFNDTQSDIKIRLKNLIKKWNQLLPGNKKSNKVSRPSNSNGCNKVIKVSEPSNNIHYNNENHKEKPTSKITKTHKSSNNLEFMNGMKSRIKDDCDKNPYELPLKKLKLDDKSQFSDSPKTLLKEIHLDSDSCPPIYKSNNIHLISQTKHDSPMHFPDVNNLFKRNEDHQINVSPSVTKDKHRKRKVDIYVNGVVATPLQKIKSTRELLAEVGDLVGSDTKKKILCNEIALEEDIPKSCIPESVRPKPKLSKSVKNAQFINESVNKTLKYSPKLLQSHVIGDENGDEDYMTNDYTEYSSGIRSSNVDSVPENLARLEKNHSYNNLKENNRSLSNHNIVKSSLFNNHSINNSPLKSEISKRSPNYDNINAQSITTPTHSDDLEKCSLKIKIPLKPYKKKSKHHDPPITNRMNDLPPLPDITSLQPNLDSYIYNAAYQTPTEITDEIVDLFAHLQWNGYNCTEHPITHNSLGFSETYIVDDLFVFAWTDTVNSCNSYFPDDTDSELAFMYSTIDNYSWC